MQPSLLLKVLLFATLVAPSSALATAKGAPKVHVVANGERIDTIAKRYGITTAALRKLNGLATTVALKRGQRLTIPESADDDAQELARGTEPSPSKTSVVPASLARGSLPPRHRVARGETLGHIALRYGTTVEALAAANGIKDGSIRAGQLLALPESAEPSAPWRRYSKPLAKRGYIDVANAVAHFAGPAVDTEGRLLPSAVRALNGLLGAGGSHPPLPERLIRLLIRVSDDFGGRAIRVVSGYRSSSWYQDSRHKVSSAVDFIVLGVPNEIVRDYLREFDDVGVGYYPNSSFVHLDVRNHSAYWIDYAGPGEPPRSSPNSPAVPRGAERRLLAELDELLQHATKAIRHPRGAGADGEPRARTSKATSTLNEGRAAIADRPQPRSPNVSAELPLESGTSAGAAVSGALQLETSRAARTPALEPGSLPAATSVDPP